MGRLCFVTGGTRGIGKAMAIEFKKSGYRVAVGYEKNDEAAEAFTGATCIRGFKFDVGQFEECAQAVKRIEEEVGAIDILVNNAGIVCDSAYHRMQCDQWHRVIQTNLTSCFNMTKAVFDGMRARQFGRIINISSVNGQAGRFGQVNYAAAKSGILGFTKALALEGAARGITVNAIAPGYISTDMISGLPSDILDRIVAGIPVGRLGSVGDVARAALFLAADEASFITGSTLSINGGQHMD